MQPAVINLREQASLLPELWSPKIVTRINDQYVKVVRVEGEFVWHEHAREDEMFLILKGSLTIQFEDGELTLNEGDCCVVPRGLRHNPVAHQECWLALIEPATTEHTGDVIDQRTRSIAEQLGDSKPSGKAD